MRNQRWVYQQDDTGCNTTILLTLINQAKSKKETTVVKLGWWGLQFRSIRLILSIVFVLIDAINYVDSIDRINRTNPVVLTYSAVQLKKRHMNQQTLGWPLGFKKGNFSKLLAFTGIWKYFTRSVWEINNITLGVMTSNSPWGGGGGYP